MTTNNQITLKFFIYPEIKNCKLRASALILGDSIVIKLLFKAPRGQYQSFISDALGQALKIFNQ